MEPTTDHGSRAGAEGAATVGADGYWRYVVAKDEATTAVCGRFGILNVADPQLTAGLMGVDGAPSGCWPPALGREIFCPFHDLGVRPGHSGKAARIPRDQRVRYCGLLNNVTVRRRCPFRDGRDPRSRCFGRARLWKALADTPKRGYPRLCRRRVHIPCPNCRRRCPHKRLHRC